jgi:hypothetical protein
MKRTLTLVSSALIFQSCTAIDDEITDTGKVSFWLYGIFIAITIVAMVFAVYAIKKSAIETEKLGKIIDIFKYAIVSVAIGTITLIVSDLFKEREQDVRELEYFGRYAEIVRQGKIEERIELSKYLSIVAPAGGLKTSWKNYYDTLKIESARINEAQRKKVVLDTIESPSFEQTLLKDSLAQFIKRKKSPLVSSANSSSNVLFRLAYPSGTLPLVFVTITGLTNDVIETPLLSPSDKEMNLPPGEYKLALKEGSGFHLTNNQDTFNFKVDSIGVTKVLLELKRDDK